MIDFSAIPVVTYVFFGLFLLASAVHLFFCYVENEKWRKITKPMTCLMLLVAVMTWNIQAYTVWLALLFGWLGDVALLKKHKVLPFVLGMLFFMVDHILNIASVCLIAKPSWPFYVGAVVFLILFALIGYHFTTKIVHQKKIAFGGTVYFGLLTESFAFAIIGSALGYSNFLLLSIFGGLCFIVSDVFLSYSSFVRNFKRRDFFIMSTYLLAQLLVVGGLMLTLAIH